MRILCAFALVGVLCAPAEAGPITIEVLSAQHQTFVSADEHTDTGTISTVYSHTKDAIVPIADEILWDQEGRTFGASAVADLLHVSTFTSSGFIAEDWSVFSDHQKAHALTTLLFSPLSTGAGDFTMEFAAGGSNPMWSSGHIRLTDTTLNELIVERGWDQPEGFFKTGTVPWNAPTPDPVSLPFTVYFDASHIYQLELYARSDANWDSQRIDVGVQGIHTVPEPAGLALIGVAMSVIYCRRRLPARNCDHHAQTQDARD